MVKQYEMRLAGSGGQGIILATIILANAALYAGKYTAQSQSYGPEARGGLCKAETIVSDHEIGFPKVRMSDFLLALTQESLDKYASMSKPGSILIVDDELRLADWQKTQNVYRLPILRTARETVGKAFTANIVAVGAIGAIVKLFDYDALQRAVLAHVPKGTEERNQKALRAGWELVESLPNNCKG